MDVEAMGAIVENTGFCSIIQNIAWWLIDQAIKIGNKFKELWSPRNEGQSCASGSRSSAAGSSPSSGSTNSLLAVSMAEFRSSVPFASRAENRARMKSSPAPGPSSSARLNDESDAVENRGDSGFESFQTPMNKVERKRKKSDSHLNQPAQSTTQESRKQVRRAKANKIGRLAGS